MDRYKRIKRNERMRMIDETKEEILYFANRSLEKSRSYSPEYIMRNAIFGHISSWRFVSKKDILSYEKVNPIIDSSNKEEMYKNSCLRLFYDTLNEILPDKAIKHWPNPQKKERNVEDIFLGLKYSSDSDIKPMSALALSTFNI